MARRLEILLASGLCCVSLAARAHHSYTEYDDTQTVEVAGKLVDIAWQNPHARIVVETADAAGKPVTWEIESAGLNNFRRMNVPLEVFKVGDTVKVAGWPSKRSPVRMYGTNLLSGDGQELVMWRYSKARISSRRAMAIPRLGRCRRLCVGRRPAARSAAGIRHADRPLRARRGSLGSRGRRPEEGRLRDRRLSAAFRLRARATATAV
jgi:hypothetical protein